MVTDNLKREWFWVVYFEIQDLHKVTLIERKLVQIIL